MATSSEVDFRIGSRRSRGAAAESLAADGDLLRRKVGISRALISL
jgi:hypothetical protein